MMHHAKIIVATAVAGLIACRSTAPAVEMREQGAATVPSLAASASQAPAERRPAAPVLELRLVGESAELPEYAAMDGRPLRLEKDVIVAAKDVASARANGASVSLKLTPEATATFETATGANLGRRLAIVVHGEVAQAPVIKVAIASGNIGFDTRSERDASALVQALQPTK